MTDKKKPTKPQKKESKEKSPLMLSYLELRQVIGILGISFPFVVSLGGLFALGLGVQSSISAYYHTGMRDAFVGILWAIGFFLFSYKGYERKDDIAGSLACVFAVGVSMYPVTPDGAETAVTGMMHQIFATLLFLTLTYFCFFLFTKTHPGGKPTLRKVYRNRVYRTCGAAMSLCILLIALYNFGFGGQGPFLGIQHPVFWLEALAIVAFGLSWFTKGEAILWDEN